MADRKKILIIDDSAFMRRVISDIINEDDRCTVVGVAADGKEGLEKIRKLEPDVITLDVQMPVMDGLTMLKELMKERFIPVILLSALAKEDAEVTLKALELGAVDFVLKPQNIFKVNTEQMKEEIIQKIIMAASLSAKSELFKSEKNRISKPLYATKETGTEIVSSKGIGENKEKSVSIQRKDLETNILGSKFTGKKTEKTSTNKNIKKEKVFMQSKESVLNKKMPVVSANKIIALGISTGGPKALQDVVPYIPENIQAGMVIVQHMPAGFTKSLADRLNSLSKVYVKEAEDGEIIKSGCVYVAPGDYHLKIDARGREYIIKLSSEPPIGGHRPSVNVMMNSLSKTNIKNVVAVIMTGMGNDGCEGMTTLKRNNSALTIAQDEASSVVYGMPKAVAEAGIVDKVVPLNEIAREITKMIEGC